MIFRRGEGIVLFEPSVVAINELTGEVEAVGAAGGAGVPPI